MKKARITCVIAAMILAAGFAAPLLADDEATIETLCARPWKIMGSAWGGMFRVRVFKKDGTFTTQDVNVEAGTWSISATAIVLTFADNKHTDTISLPLNPDGTDGTDAEGQPTIAVQLPPPPPPATPDVSQKALDITNGHHNDLVLVSGTDGAATGFIAVLGKSNFLFTDTRLVAAINNASFKTLGGVAIPTGAASVAVGRNVFCMAAPAGGAPLEIMQDVDKNAAAGDDVAVLVNTEGEGVVQNFTGRILKIEPDRVEITANSIPGCMGAPIIHLKSGKIIGLATFAKTDVHQYGCRLDNVKGWQTMDWRAFYAQAGEMDKIAVTTSELGIFFGDVVKTGGKIKMEQYTTLAIADCFMHWQNDTAGKRSDDDIERANRTLVAALKIVSQADVAAARRRMAYDYFQRELADEQKARDSMADGFKKLIDNFSD